MMLGIKKLPFFFLFLFLLNACSKQNKEVFSSKEELQDYLNDEMNSFQKSIIHNDVCVSSTYYPSAMFSEEFDSTNKLYFILNFSYKNKELLANLPQDRYGEMVQLFSFGMQDYIYLLDNGEKIYPDMVSYSPTYNLSNANTLIVVFDKLNLLKKEKDDLILTLDDFGLNLGTIQFVYNSQILNYNPVIHK
ncbi:Uncharacterised protein [Sphingobacterium spiritivorum]|uniref:Lipoprotein n=1 Tax=Sphingobacterium spiritivorum TaxID=258 RepID=A0A380CR40_SPHSI|nr:hypothetical protein [Sphingobacterium spiritivorum]SUJ25583.1 Uncharacterised protein [Sphingobacterium spiritivorum]